MFSMKIKHNILSKSINYIYIYQQNLIICFMVNLYSVEIFVYWYQFSQSAATQVDIVKNLR